MIIMMHSDAKHKLNITIHLYVNSFVKQLLNQQKKDKQLWKIYLK